MLNIKSLMPVTLDLNFGNYTQWCGLILVTLDKYALADHVLTNLYRPDRQDWMCMDCIVVLWLYGTISVDLLESVMTHNTTARIVQRGLKPQFLGNRESHALNLSTEFYNFYQDDLSINDYCCLLKTMADDLDDVGNRTLSLTTIRGLNEKFGHLQSAFTMQKPFPTFAGTAQLAKNRRAVALAKLHRSPQTEADLPLPGGCH